MVSIRDIEGDNGKENGNSRDYRVYIGVISGVRVLASLHRNLKSLDPKASLEGLSVFL